MFLVICFVVSMEKELANLQNTSHDILLQLSIYRKNLFLKMEIVEILYFSHGHNFFHSKFNEKVVMNKYEQTSMSILYEVNLPCMKQICLSEWSKVSELVWEELFSCGDREKIS